MGNEALLVVLGIVLLIAPEVCRIIQLMVKED